MVDSFLILNPKKYSKIYTFYFISFFLCLSSFVISNINYILRTYKFNYSEEYDPNIYLSGIKNFSFDYNKPFNPKYYPTISNLGTTGDLIYDCYNGLCKYEEEFDCITYECDDDNHCHREKDRCTETVTLIEDDSSNLCRNTNGKSCNACNAEEEYSYRDLEYKKCSCSREKDTKVYWKHGSCTVDNLIFNWKNYYYNRENASYYDEYSYLNSAVASNETCDETKYHQCGILDELGNKLCYPNNKKCPINYITLDKSDHKYNYSSYIIDGVTVYYTNEAINDGKVLGGFFVDTDLMIKYNIGDCQIISTGNISELLNSHENKLYRDSLLYDPYKDKNIDEKGKAYLKWCIPGFGKEKNITKINKTNEIFLFNKTNNKEILEPIKTKIKISYFICLPGFIGLIVAMIFLVFAFNTQNKRKSTFNCKCITFKGVIILLIFIISFILIFIGSVYSMVIVKKLFKAIDLNLNQNIIKVLTILNIIGFSINMLLIILFIVSLKYLYDNDSDFETKNNILYNPDFNPDYFQPLNNGIELTKK